MPIANCPKCKLEFSADDALDRPQTCPACKTQFLFVPGMAEVAAAQSPGGKPRVSPGRLRFVAWVTTVLGLAVDATLIAGNAAFLRESASGRSLAWPDLLPSFVLAVAVLAHAALSVLALRMLGSQPRLTVLFGRLAVVCWLVLGGAAVLLGVHLWPASLTSQPDNVASVAAFALIVLGALLTYLGGLEWLSQRLARK